MEEIQAPSYIGSFIRWSYIKKYLPRTENGILLDVGCGGGEYQDLAEKKGYKYIGVDIDPMSIGMRADICNLPFDDDTMDVVLCVDVLEHIKNDHKAISELHRVLKNGGLLLLHVPNMNQKHILIEKPEEQHDHERVGYDPVLLNTLCYEFSKHSCYATFDEFEMMAWDLNFAMLNKLYIEPYHIILNRKNGINYGWIAVAKK